MRTFTIATVGLLAVMSQLAFAHTELTTSMPINKSVLKTAPAEIALQFSENVRLTALSLQKHDGPPQDLQPLPTNQGRAFAIPAPDSGEGMYMVKWRAVGADSHVISGEIAYTVSATAAASAVVPAAAHSSATSHGH